MLKQQVAYDIQGKLSKLLDAEYEYLIIYLTRSTIRMVLVYVYSNSQKNEFPQMQWLLHNKFNILLLKLIHQRTAYGSNLFILRKQQKHALF